MTRTEVEAALAAGHLWALMRSGKWWRVRRNGATKLWKTRPNDYRIPVKAGLRAYGYVTPDAMRVGSFKISEEKPQ